GGVRDTSQSHVRDDNFYISDHGTAGIHHRTRNRPSHHLGGNPCRQGETEQYQKSYHVLDKLCPQHRTWPHFKNSSHLLELRSVRPRKQVRPACLRTSIDLNIFINLNLWTLLGPFVETMRTLAAKHA